MDMCIDMCMDKCRGMYMGMCTYICMGMCMDMCTSCRLGGKQPRAGRPTALAPVSASLAQARPLPSQGGSAHHGMGHPKSGPSHKRSHHGRGRASLRRLRGGGHGELRQLRQPRALPGRSEVGASSRTLWCYSLAALGADNLSISCLQQDPGCMLHQDHGISATIAVMRHTACNSAQFSTGGLAH